jgi:hypothetical protein
MNWTRTRPTVPGRYWLFEEGQPIELVLVTDLSESLIVWGHTWRDYDHIEQYQPSRTLWMGPIDPPPLPSL